MAVSNKFYAIIAGVGAGTGRSLAVKFSQTYPVVLLSRSAENYQPIVDEIKKAGGEAYGFSTDTADEANVTKTFASIKSALGERQLAAAVYNVGGRFVRKPFLELSTSDFTAGFEGNGLGGFNFAKATIPLLLNSVDTKPPFPPSLIVTGATASLKGSANCASFASGKFALRALTQSLAREFGPKGVHVSHAIIDAVIDIPRTKDYVVNGGVEGSKSDPDAIADSYWYLHTQPTSAFTFEIDIRPFVEKW